MNIGLYIEDEVRHKAFLPFLTRCEFWKSDQTNLSEIWAEIGLGPFSASNPKVSQLKYPDYRVVHRMIVNTVHQRKSSHDKVDKIDLWILEQITNDDYTNVPFVLAKMFVDARGYREKSGLLFGQYITRLARSHGVLSERVTNSLTRVGEMGLIDEYQLKGMKANIRKTSTGEPTIQWNRGFMEVPTEETHSQPISGGKGGSSSHQATPEWDAYRAYQELQNKFHQFSLGQADVNQFYRQTDPPSIRNLHTNLR